MNHNTTKSKLLSARPGNPADPLRRGSVTLLTIKIGPDCNIEVRVY